MAGVHLAAAEADASPDMEAVWLLVDVATHAAKAVGERRNAITFLDAQLLSTADLKLTAMRGHRSQHGQLVDDAGHFVRRDHGRTHTPVFHGQVAGWLADARSGGRTAVRLDGDRGPHPPYDVDDARPCGVQADTLYNDPRA